MRRYFLFLMIGLLIFSFSVVSAEDVPEKIKIPYVVSLTGNYSKGGQQYEGSYKYAAWEVNQDGGIYIEEYDKKIPVELIAFDDQSDSDLTVEMMERACNVDDAVAILGGFPTSIVYLQSSIAERNKIPYVNSGGAGRNIYARGFEWVFGTASPVDRLGTTLMGFLKHNIDEGNLSKPFKVAVVVEDTSHGLDYQKGIKKYIEEHPEYFELKYEEIFEMGKSSYSSILSQVEMKDVDGFLCDAHLEDYITMHREYVERGLYHEVVSYGARGPQSAAFEALGDSGAYNIAATWWDSRSTNPVSQKFVEGFKEVNGFAPEMNAYGYIAPKILFNAIENAGTLDPDAIRESLKNTKLENTIIAGGTVEFNEDQQAEFPFIVVQVMPGKTSEIVWPEESATADYVLPIPQE